MSRIGKKLIKIPQGVEVKAEDSPGQGIKVWAKGPKGELEKELSLLLDIQISDGSVSVGLKDMSEFSKKRHSNIWGLGRALIATMIKGVSEGFQRILEFSGIGFKAQAKNGVLELSLGFTNPVIIKAPEGVTFQVEKNTIKVLGPDKERVGHAAALIRAAKPPEPYKGTGIKYKEEIIKRKAGKKAVATSG